MKKTVIPAVLLTLSLLGSCAAPGAESPVPTPGETPPPWGESPTWVSCRIVDGGAEDELLLAELDHPLTDGGNSSHNGKNVYRLPLTREVCREEPGGNGETVAVTERVPLDITLDGKPATAADLADGMVVEVAYMGDVEETFPAGLPGAYEVSAWSIGTPQCPGGSYYDLCGLYLQVLNDLWETDPGLNSGITLAGLDLSEAPGGLLDSEKAALAWRFGEQHGVEVVTGTFEELAAEGYFTAVSDHPERPLYQWEEGCLFTIGPNGDHEGEVFFGLPVLHFDARKWRSPLGGYYFSDCSAIWPEMGTWSGYQVGAEAIS